MKQMQLVYKSLEEGQQMYTNLKNMLTFILAVAYVTCKYICFILMIQLLVLSLLVKIRIVRNC